jgi:hypothetical protein
MLAVERTPSSGGELLRAVLDNQAIGADYALYNIIFPITPITNPGLGFFTLRSTFQCKSDCWFLLTNLYGNNRSGYPPGENVTWNVVSGANSRSFIDNQALRIFALLFNEDLASRASMPEYRLFAPADMITVECRTQLTFFNPFQDTNEQDFMSMTLEGIEYRF